MSDTDPDRESGGWPTVSVVMPVRNEAPHLERAIRSILAQDYPIPFDVCLAVGPSDDGTEAVAAGLAAADPRVRVVPNPAGLTPAGLNAAIRATRGDVVVRVDGHAELSYGYIRRAVETMRRTGAVNVGGVQLAQGTTPFERVVADAMTSWFGTGGARFHVGGDEGPVDTVYLGVFDRRAGDAVGWFDETLVRNQDYELNIRLRDAGGTIWFDPGLQVAYRPRGSWAGLSRQYREYGFWKAEVLRRHPGSLKLRQAIPPLAVGTLAVAVLTAPFSRVARLISALGLAGWLGAGAIVDRRRPLTAAGVLATMHASWAVGLAAGAWRGSVPGDAGSDAGSDD